MYTSGSGEHYQCALFDTHLILRDATHDNALDVYELHCSFSYCIGVQPSLLLQ